ncbi:MAG: hypothetical protein A3G38_00365 [Omnitrophica WOR_2 bacterium RIFCSPLOWO2_12_FULL_51_8]|nr:MAG: hypothetical protein A3G38_00365 [Omnitrophica WOR_2 bacterium RIFCSPLOWO2_12_FULL_51_8]
MGQKIESLIKAAYRQWKAAQPKACGAHPGEEQIACFLEGRLSRGESSRVISHLLVCDDCAEALSLSLKTEIKEERPVPAELIARLKDLAARASGFPLWEIILKVKEQALELLSNTGDVLAGRELLPAPALRGRSARDFKDEVNIFKDFAGIRVQLKIEKKAAREFNLTITARERQTQRIIKDLRVSLFRADLELESRLSDTGAVTFEHVLLGKYAVEITSAENKLASVSLDIKV